MNDKTCPFCGVPASEIVLEDTQCYARWDKFPVTPGHMLIIPKRHVAGYFEITTEEREALWNMVQKAKELLEGLHHPEAYNIGINVGEQAGQTIPHCHIHLIPRRPGDMKDPRGGVRGVIPEKRKY